MPISIDHNVVHGQPVVQGTRIPVAVILEELAAGTPTDDVVREYGISVQDIRDCLTYAQELVSEV